MDYQRIGETFSKLIETIKALRTPETGCPWDLEQDHQSLRPYLLEEAHEVLQAIDQGDDVAFCEELGDLLLQVVLHAQVASDRDSFGIEEVVRAIDEKMIRRHPHVFKDVQVSDSAEVLKNWEAIKLAEQASSTTTEGPDSLPYSAKLLDIPLSLPALVRGQRIGEKASKFNFDWRSIEGVHAKVKEEMAELEVELKNLPKLSSKKDHPDRAKQVISKAQHERLEHEIGDLLFSVCQLARWLGVHSEDALRLSSDRFLKRFSTMEENLSKPLEDMSEEELEAAWQSAKRSILAKS